jgi:hypothetical protein
MVSSSERPRSKRTISSLMARKRGTLARPTSITHASRTTQSWKKGSAASCLGRPTKVHSSPTSSGSAERAAATTPQ